MLFLTTANVDPLYAALLAENAVRQPLILGVYGLTMLVQFLLSTRKNRYLGWILPALSAVLSFLNGWPSALIPGSAGFFGQLLQNLLLYNVPTIPLVVLYFACRWLVRKKNTVEKMNIQDL